MPDISAAPLVINLGDLPSWVIAGVAAAGLWKAWKAERNSAKAATIAASSATAIEAIHKETNSMRSQLETAATARGVLVGRTQVHDEHAAQLTSDKDTVRSDAISDAETAEKIKGIQSPIPDQK
jgi:hypothetical protein